MKKITIVSAASFFFLLLCSAVAVLLGGVLTDAVTACIIGGAILSASGILAACVRTSRTVNLVCFFISAVAMGVLMRAWYINRGFDNTFAVMTLVSLSCVLYLWVFFALSKLPFMAGNRKMYILLCIIYAILSAVAYLIVMLNTKTTYVSTFGYYMILELAFIFAMSMQTDTVDGLIRNLTLSSYSVLIVGVIVAVFVIMALLAGDGGSCDCDCDCGDGCCDGCDCSSGDGRKKKKRAARTPKA